ncbi:MAG: GNAT family N-acetyltransferase [Firmicutes bacterium]|nr:GNAT family N-acetyltransferase [Bacillota bacterium]
MLEILFLKGKEAEQHVNELAMLRIKYFREYPYLYDGNLEYERLYLGSYINNEKAILVLAKDCDKIIGLSTAIPLVSDYHILEGAADIFSNSGLKPDEFYYFGEIIILPEYRGRGIASLIFKQQEEYARSLGYKGVCFLVVIREGDHPLKPKDYEEPDAKWMHMGYEKTNTYTYFEWPTIQPSRETENVNNKMVYWIKKLT